MSQGTETRKKRKELGLLADQKRNEKIDKLQVRFCVRMLDPRDVSKPSPTGGKATALVTSRGWQQELGETELAQRLNLC